MQVASIRGDEKIVEMLLKEGDDDNAYSERHGSALRAASFGGHEKIVELLLKEGADANGRGWYGSVLQAASSQGHEKIVELLLKEGADVNTQGGEHDNALQEASVGGQEKIARGVRFQ